MPPWSFIKCCTEHPCREIWQGKDQNPWSEKDRQNQRKDTRGRSRGGWGSPPPPPLFEKILFICNTNCSQVSGWTPPPPPPFLKKILPDPSPPFEIPWSAPGQDSASFTLMGLHASHYRGTCVVHAARHVPCLFAARIPNQRRTGKTRVRTGQTLLGLHASRYTGTCVLDMHVPCLFAIRIPNQRRTGKTRWRTGQHTLHSACIPLQRNMLSACC